MSEHLSGGVALGLDGPAPTPRRRATGLRWGTPGSGRQRGARQSGGSSHADRPLQRLRAFGTRLFDAAQRAGRPVFWLTLITFILAPCACFLALAVSPRLFDQGSQWFTFTYLQQAFNGTTATALADSLWVSVTAALIGVAIGFPLAWLVARTTMPGRRFIRAAMWLVLLLPSWLPALGWVRLVETDGVMYRMGLDWPWVTHLVLGPFGVVMLLGLRAVPFAFLAVTAAFYGLGQEFEDAARVHGAGRARTLSMIARMVAPAIWSALAIGFAESVSDFGVASVLAYTAHFPLLTYQLYTAIGSFPPNFPGAAAMGWLLVASVAVPLALQARALKGRSYAVLSGRTRLATPAELGRLERLGAAASVGIFILLALGVPALGAVSGSLLGDYGSSFSLTLANYRAVFASSELFGPVERSLVYGALAASVTVVGGLVAARMLTSNKGRRTARALDFLLLASVALPSVVFAAGYIFAYNLPIMSRFGINLYQTTTLLLVAYVAASLPTNARVLVGPISQIQPSLHEAARTHGAGPIRAWARGVLPAVSRPLVMAWVLTFTAVFLELPISELLYAPNSPPVSVAIQDNLGNYHFGVGVAQAVVSVVTALVAVGFVLGLYRLLAPRGWRRIGALNRG